MYYRSNQPEPYRTIPIEAAESSAQDMESISDESDIATPPSSPLVSTNPSIFDLPFSCLYK